MSFDPIEPNIRVYVAVPHVKCGESPRSWGRRPLDSDRIIDILGGTVEGPVLNGIIIPGGADWQIVAPGWRSSPGGPVHHSNR